MFNHNTIFGRVFSRMVLLLAISISLVITLVIIQTVKYYTIRLDNDYKSILYTYNNDLLDRINAVSTIPRLLAMHPTLMSSSPDIQHNILRRHYQSMDGSLLQITILSLEGTKVASYPNDNKTLINYEYSEILDNLDLSKEYSIVKFNGIGNVIVPVINHDSKELIGYLLGILNYSDGLIMSSIQSYANPDLNVFVMDRHANMLAHNDSQHIGKVHDIKVVLDDKEVLIEELLSEKRPEVQTLDYEFEGVFRRGLYLYNSDLDIYLGISRLKETTTEILFYLWEELGIMLLASLIPLLFISFNLTRSIINPIKKLEEHANNLATQHDVVSFHTAGETKELKPLRNAIESIVKSLNTAYFSVMSALAKAMEEKDNYTEGHAQRVTKISIKIGRELGLSSQELSVLRFASTLHDIGKLAVPDSILLKPGKLTDEEFEVIKKHPVISENIASQSPFFKNALPGIRYHHEWFDGNGYPDGLKGNELPYLARIISVADAFDAMTTSRPYRKAMSVEDAVTEIKNNSGKQFDPIIVKAFLKIVEQHKYNIIHKLEK